eukprot:s3658_g7.t4
MSVLCSAELDIFLTPPRLKTRCRSCGNANITPNPRPRLLSSHLSRLSRRVQLRLRPPRPPRPPRPVQPACMASWVRRAGGHRLSLEAYCSNLNIAAASRSSAWRLALAALHDAAEPDLVSFNSAAAACARATQWPRALRLLGNLAANALRADQRTWTPLLPVLPWPRALQVLRHLEERSLHLDPPLLSAALAATARAQAWAAMLQLLNELRARDEGGRGFAVGLSAAIQSLAKASRWTASLGLVQEAHETRRLRDDVVLLSTCLLACRAGALWQLGLCLLQEGAGLPITAAAPYNSAISACAEASQWQTALQLLAEAKCLGILDVTTCNASITACDRGHAWQHAMQVLEALKEQPGLRADAFSSAAAVSSCASAAQWRMALGLAAKELPGPFALSALLAACGAARRWEYGLAIWQGWPAGRDLDLTCQNAALQLFAALGRWVAALQVLDAMRALGTTDALSLEACQKSCEVAGAWPPMPRLWQAAAKEAMLSRSRANEFAVSFGVDESPAAPGAAEKLSRKVGGRRSVCIRNLDA